MKPAPDNEERTNVLLRVAAYLGRPQKFMAVADARAELRRTLELATKGSVVLTAHGEPEVAVVPFTTLEDMRRALLHLLVEEMEASLDRSRKRLGNAGAVEHDEDSVVEIAKEVGEVLRKARRRNSKSGGRASRG